MPRDEKRRQKSLARKASKRKQKKQALVRRALPSSPRAQLKAAAHWPLEECLISRDWDTPGELVQIVVARSSPDGQIAAGVFLVDLACLGVKNAFGRLFPLYGEYDEVRRNIHERQPLMRADLNLAAKIIREGIAYARGLGFSPHPDYHDAAILLGDADPDASDAHIPLGVDGKPLFVSGPYDNVPRIMAQLERSVGQGNYDFVIGIGPEQDVLDEEEY